MKKARELTDLQVRRLTKTPGVHFVGGVDGLTLVVKESGAAAWKLRYTMNKHREHFGLGGYPSVTLEQARANAREARELIRRGIDPREERKAAIAAATAAAAKLLTFRRAAETLHTAIESEFRNAKHRKDWLSSLERYAFPKLGEIPVAEVELAHVVSVLTPIWVEKTETATRVRQRMEKVFDWAIVSGYRERAAGNPAEWSGTLEHALPKPGKLKSVAHHAALPWQDVPAFVAELRKLGGMGARALEFAILTAARSGEVRKATWAEIDVDARLWSVPAERMKAKKPHTVPLSGDAIALLESLPRFDGSPYVFPAVRGGALSDMTLSAVCRRMKVDAVPHGFRSSFRDWAAESTNYPRDVAEQALAHALESKVEAAYRRGDLLAKRTRLMRDWAKFLSTPPIKATATPIRRAK